MRYIVYFTFLLLTFSLKGQVDNNFYKYWTRRNNLKYFVKIGDQPGQSVIAGTRGYDEHTPYEENNLLNWGQTGINMGEYIGVLATEWKLLHDNNEATDDTYDELISALQALNRLDNFESIYGPPQTDREDGMIVRDDVPCDFLDYNDMNYDLTPNETFEYFIQNGQYGIPGYVQGDIKSDWCATYQDPNNLSVMSQDEAIGIMIGMALVVKCLPSSSEAVSLAKAFTHRMITYIYNDGSWLYLSPLGDDVPGNDANFNSYGFKEAAYYILGDSYPYTDYSSVSRGWVVFTPGYFAWQTIIQGPANLGHDQAHMAASLAAIGNSWGSQTQNTIQGISLYYHWFPFYNNLNAYLHNPSNFVDATVLLLNTAPCNNSFQYMLPSGYRLFSNGWGCQGKFWNKVDNQDGDGLAISGVFNGTGYMLLYNLNMLLKEENGYYIAYYNPVNRTLTWHYPHMLLGGFIVGWEDYPAHYECTETITSTQVIDDNVMDSQGNIVGSTPGYETLKAGQKIKLKPDFRVKAGSYFHAYIEPWEFDCNGPPPSYYGPHSLNKEDTTNLLSYKDLLLRYDSIKNVMKGTTHESETVENNPDYAIYPNPNNGQFNVLISSDNSNKFNLNITDIVGKTVYSKQNLSGTEQTVDITNLNSGIYFFKIEINGEIVYSDKVIKK